MRALLALVLVTAPALAQTPTETITKVETAYATAKQVTGTFTQTTVNAIFGSTAVSTGTFAAERPNKLEFAYVKKSGKPDKSFLVDGTHLWHIDHGGKAVVQTAIGTSSLPAALAFLQGTKGAIAKSFKIASPSNPAHLVPGATVIELTPLQASASYTSVELVIDPTASTVTRSVVYDPQGGSTTYDFANVDLKAKLAANHFVFDAKKYADYKLTPLASKPAAPKLVPTKPSSKVPGAPTPAKPISPTRVE